VIAMEDVRMTKSRFLSGLQCPKRLWWEVHEPEAPELEPAPARQFVFDQGHEVGRVAQSYVPGGILINVPHYERERRLRETADAMRGGARALYEAAFEHAEVFVAVDILERDRGGWNLVEVKSSTYVKPEHVPDVAIQAHVLRGTGVAVRRAELMHLNRACRHPDLSNLFAREDVGEEVEALSGGLPEQIRALRRALEGALPEAEIGERCFQPHECPFLKRCWPEPPPHSIATLYRLSRDQREEYESEGYRTLLDLPEGEALTRIQDRQRRAARSNGLVVDSGLAEVLDELALPFAYLDFETVASPIPVWTGCRPYDQVPVQLSVHRETRGGVLTHHEWLADGPDDPRETIARKLIEFTEGARTILAYHAPFETHCIRALQEHLPRLAAGLETVAGRLRDLLPIVRDHVYHPAFNGHFGLKSVAPALAPGIDYDTLEIAEGSEASQVLYGLLLKGESMIVQERERLRRDLLRYCRTDTEAMVRLHRALVSLVGR
jgi:uncharacterized protein DUF2779